MLINDVTLSSFGIAVSVLHGFSVINKTAIALIMISQKKSRLFFRFMGLIIFCPVLLLVSNYFNYLGYGVPVWVVALNCMLNTFMFWAAFYVLHPIFQVKYGWHSRFLQLCTFVPFAAILVYLVWLWATMQPADYALFERRTANQVEGSVMQGFNYIIYFNVMLYSALMVFFMVRMRGYKHHSLISEKATFVLKLKFAQKFVYALFASSYGVVFTVFFTTLPVREYIIIPIVSNLLVFYLIYLILGSGVIRFKFNHQYFYKNFLRFDLEVVGTAPLCHNQLPDLANRIRQHFEQNAPYINPDYSVNDLAKQLGTPAYLITNALNNGMQTSFLALVNQHRVEAVKKLLSSPKGRQYNVAGIGGQCGFKSKSALYRQFKEHTGLTPGQYLRQQDGDLQDK